MADQDEWAAAWRLTLCGLRRSEVMGLRWDAVDLDRGEIVVQAGRVLLDGHRTATEGPKSSASHRTVPVEAMHPGTVALLRTLKARQASDRLVLGAGYAETGYVLVDPLGAPIRPEAYSDRFAVLSHLAGVPKVRLHSVRNTVATIMHGAGQAPADAAALLGTRWRFTCPSTSSPPRKALRPPRAASERPFPGSCEIPVKLRLERFPTELIGACP